MFPHARLDVTSFLSMIGLPHNSLHARLLEYAAELELERARSVIYAPIGFGKRHLLSILDELAVEQDPAISLESSAPPRRMIADVSADFIRSLKGRS